MWNKGEQEKQEKQDSASAAKQPANISTYNAAVERFSKSAAAFMEQLSYLKEARDAYQQAMAASAELRKILDAGDEALRNVMANLEQSIDSHLGRYIAEKKKPERVKVETIEGQSAAGNG